MMISCQLDTICWTLKHVLVVGLVLFERPSVPVSLDYNLFFSNFICCFGCMHIPFEGPSVPVSLDYNLFFTHFICFLAVCIYPF